MKIAPTLPLYRPIWQIYTPTQEEMLARFKHELAKEKQHREKENDRARGKTTTIHC